jgi:hypothetical protein
MPFDQLFVSTPRQRNEDTPGLPLNPLPSPPFPQVKCHACVGGTSVREDARILSSGVHVVSVLFGAGAVWEGPPGWFRGR